MGYKKRAKSNSIEQTLEKEREERSHRKRKSAIHHHSSPLVHCNSVAWRERSCPWLCLGLNDIDSNREEKEVDKHRSS